MTANYIHEYSVRNAIHSFESGLVLQKDGNDCFCPLAQPIPIPVNNGGSIQLNPQQQQFAPCRIITCSTGCPMANISETTSSDGEKTYSYETNCGKFVSNKVSLPQPEKEENNKKGIKLVSM